jgi:hypothetical protein
MVDIFIMRANVWGFFGPSRAISIIAATLCAGFIPGHAWAQTPSSPACRIESRNFQGWHAEEMSNPWVKVTIVPQLEAWFPLTDRSF